MSKKLFLLAFGWMWVAGLFAQEDSLMYRVTLADKDGCGYSVRHPEKFLSQKAIERRKKQHLKVDETDLPLSRKYLNQISAEGAKVVVKVKWQNSVVVSSNDTLLPQRLRQLPFVKNVELVWRMPAKGNGVRQYSTGRQELCTEEPPRYDDPYGAGATQIDFSNGKKLHEAGFRGQGMTIAVIDGGFHNADRIESMKNIRVLGTKNFINPQHANLFAEGMHGTMVLSCIGMNQPHFMIGTAPEASFWLIQSEDGYSEQLVEEDYLAAAIEFADSVGVDVINTSLGYHKFDDKSWNLQLRHLDGKHCFSSRQASRIADKGMILVCSAGNEGARAWKKITTPGDAENILTIGALERGGTLAGFSSIGTTADGRIKPDVVAMGMAVEMVSGTGRIQRASGTSFSSPIMCGLVACLWQACPTLTAYEVMDLLRECGDRAAFPDNIYGYGIPDVWKGYQNYLQHKK